MVIVGFDRQALGGASPSSKANASLRSTDLTTMMLTSYNKSTGMLMSI